MRKTKLFFNLTIWTGLLLMAFKSNGQSLATYDISITTSWTASEHTSVPNNAHWSPLIGATHSTPNEFMQIGALASLGIKNVAEVGNNTAIKEEINTAINSGRANQILEKNFAPYAPISTAAINTVLVNENFPLISLFSMVGISPDWFIAVNSLNLRSGNPAINNGWKDSFTVDVFVYDSATDSGSDYTSPNNPDTSPGTIYERTTTPTNGNKMATLSFTYNDSTLSNNVVNVLEDLKIYQNVNEGVITLSNIKNKAIKTITVFDLMGRQVFSEAIKPETNKIDLNLNANKSSGDIYILKIESYTGNSITKKLGIK